MLLCIVVIVWLLCCCVLSLKCGYCVVVYYCYGVVIVLLCIAVIGWVLYCCVGLDLYRVGHEQWILFVHTYEYSWMYLVIAFILWSSSNLLNNSEFNHNKPGATVSTLNSFYLIKLMFLCFLVVFVLVVFVFGRLHFWSSSFLVVFVLVVFILGKVVSHFGRSSSFFVTHWNSFQVIFMA